MHRIRTNCIQTKLYPDKRDCHTHALGMERLNAQEDIRHQRRPLLPDEFAKLVESARSSGTKITDAGLVHLRGLANLEVLTLLETQVTGAGVIGLSKALPDCEILH